MEVEAAMGVGEIIKLLPSLTAEERERVRLALDALTEASSGPDDGSAEQRREHIFRMLDEGWCTTGGKSLSEGIDEALYGGDG